MKILMQRLSICFALTTTLTSFIAAMDSECKAIEPTVECPIYCEAFGAKVRLNKKLEIRFKEGAPEEVCSLLLQLNNIRNRYYYGAALDAKIDAQLQEDAQEIYTKLRQWNLEHKTLTMWQPDIDNYAEDLGLTRLAGAFEIARFYYQSYLEKMMPHVRAYLDNRVSTLSLDPLADQAWIKYCLCRIKMTVLRWRLSHLQKTGTPRTADQFAVMQHEVEEVIHNAQNALASIKSSALERDNLAREVTILQDTLNACR